MLSAPGSHMITLEGHPADCEAAPWLDGSPNAPEDPPKPTRRTITFAAGLQPLAVPKVDEQATIFKSSVLLAATPHVPNNRKLFTDRCKSTLVLNSAARPATTLPAAERRSQSPPLQVAPERRCSTAPAPVRVRLFGQEVIARLPDVLQFETWWQQNGQRQRMSIDYHTVIKEFHIRGPEELWLSMVGGSGEQLDHWDLHVGAELDILGRKVMLRKGSCATVAWLDAWTKLLLRHKGGLEEQLSKFAPVLQAQGLLKREGQPCMAGDQGLQAIPTALTASGGRVNLRHLREDVAFLAWRLRQHKAAVHLPPELEDLRSEGPSVWSLPGIPGMTPQVQGPFTSKQSCRTPHYATSHQLLHQSFQMKGSIHEPDLQLPSLGDTPNTLHQLIEFNRINLWEYIQSNPLAASAAIDRRNYCQPDDPPPWRLSLLVPGGAGMRGGKNPGPFTSRRGTSTRFGKAPMS